MSGGGCRKRLGVAEKLLAQLIPNNGRLSERYLNYSLNEEKRFIRTHLMSSDHFDRELQLDSGRAYIFRSSSE